jgi:hypothetical protein
MPLLALVRWWLVLGLFGAPLPARSQRPTVDQALGNAAPPIGTPACTLDERETHCMGYVFSLHANLQDRASRAAMAAWLTNRQEITFKNGHASAWPWRRRVEQDKMEIFQTSDMTSVRISDLATVPAGRLALVVARLDANAMKDPDLMFGAGRYREQFRRSFYIVVHDYSKETAEGPYNSYAIARWSVIGLKDTTVAGRRVLLATDMNKHGSFRICTIAHDDDTRKLGAGFNECDHAPAIARAAVSSRRLRATLRQRSIPSAVAGFLPNVTAATTDSARMSILRSTSTEALFTAVGRFLTANRVPIAIARDSAVRLAFATAARDDDREEPGWIPCGVGCCTADRLY